MSVWVCQLIQSFFHFSWMADTQKLNKILHFSSLHLTAIRNFSSFRGLTRHYLFHTRKHIFTMQSLDEISTWLNFWLNLNNNEILNLRFSYSKISSMDLNFHILQFWIIPNNEISKIKINAVHLLTFHARKW